jgi:hypothetical protein
MMTSVEGKYRNGRIELTETHENVPDETRVIVTFVTPKGVELSEYGIDRVQAAHLRTQLESFAEEWGVPEMDVYDAAPLSGTVIRYDDPFGPAWPE